MKYDFKTFSLTVLIILSLLALDRLPGKMRPSALQRRTARVVREMHNGDLNAEDMHALAAGYYEGLRDDTGVAGVIEQKDILARQDFLRYELRPGLKRAYSAGMRITNSFGMQNPEYGYEKPLLTRRIALLGDSLSLGPYGNDYGALLEQRLNKDYLSPDVQHFELLNFSVYGYSVVQMMDVALDKAPKFHPDVYIVALTSLEIMGNAGWRTHVARLIRNKVDLKYEFLRSVVAQARVEPSDQLSVIEKKLTPFLLPVTRLALEQIRDHAASQGARMIVAFVPIPIDPLLSGADFDKLRQAVEPVGVPFVDLRDTFESANLQELKVSEEDIHPNARGHRLIYENLYTKLRANPEAWTILTEPSPAP
jgi:hypothetical protein